MLIFSWLLYQKWIFSNVDSCSCSSRSESLKRLSWFVLWLQVYHQLHSTGSRQPAAHLSPAGRDDRTLLLCGRHHLCRDVGADVCRWSWQQVRLMAVCRLRSRIQIQALWGGCTQEHKNFCKDGFWFCFCPCERGSDEDEDVCCHSGRSGTLVLQSIALRLNYRNGEYNLNNNNEDDDDDDNNEEGRKEKRVKREEWQIRMQKERKTVKGNKEKEGRKKGRNV